MVFWSDDETELLEDAKLGKGTRKA